MSAKKKATDEKKQKTLDLKEGQEDGSNKKNGNTVVTKTENKKKKIVRIGV